MDYVDWLDKLARALIQAWGDADYNDRSFGVKLEELVSSLGIEVDSFSPEFESSKLAEAIRDGMRDLEALGLVENERYRRHKVTELGTVLQDANLNTSWHQIMSIRIDEAEREFLEKVAELGQEYHEEFSVLNDLDGEVVASHLGWALDDDGIAKTQYVSKQLFQKGLLKRQTYIGKRIDIVPNYSGIVRVTRQTETELGVMIRELVADWENINVDFKRELYIGRMKEKAEFIRDILGLATTKARGKRYLVIGFANDTREFYESVADDINQDRLEQILNAYCSPTPQIKFDRVPWGQGEVGFIEVKRDPVDIPYRVSKKIGKLAIDAVYVRHGSHTEPPTDQELKDLEEEGKRARGELQ